MNRAERRRATVHISGRAFCFGCGDALGLRKSAPAEIFEPTRGYVHSTERCRSRAITAFVRSAKGEPA